MTELIEYCEIVEISFCTYEDSISEAITKKSLGIFIGNDERSARSIATDFVSNLPHRSIYLAWDDEIYPQYKFIRNYLNKG